MESHQREASWTVRRLHSCTDPDFDSLGRIYAESFPEGERKSLAKLSRMLESPAYQFLTVSQNGSVIGYSIAACLQNCDACLLEYMSVDSQHRGEGIGQFLFQQTAKSSHVADRLLLIEAESDKTESPDKAIRTRRKSFYRRLGCREIPFLNYLMPKVSTGVLPPMDWMVYHPCLPHSIEKDRLRHWLKTCYEQVYSQDVNDPRIAFMLEGLPDDLPLL
jgi:hypothetical protein